MTIRIDKTELDELLGIGKERRVAYISTLLHLVDILRDNNRVIITLNETDIKVLIYDEVEDSLKFEDL